jgi:hypothetical protein
MVVKSQNQRAPQKLWSVKNQNQSSSLIVSTCSASHLELQVSTLLFSPCHTLDAKKEPFEPPYL